ncbi:RagB/SusD family nutrient uptake outer membrane protein, partial [Pedobacter sp.]|uniref:RagB/SusD family nutrient uptake outer membrane protein n=1 Tax=Pedobacter sp. TaxID=1411316 RepID=UPI003D7F57BE
MKSRCFIVLALALCGSLTSCKDEFLEQQPVGAYSESVLNSREGINKTLIGAYSLLNGQNDGMVTAPGQLLFGSIRGGEANKGSDLSDGASRLEFQRFEVSTGNESTESFFAFYFDAVSRCNMVLSLLNKVEDLTSAEKTQIASEARFLRGHYYFMLKRAYRNLPWIDENSSTVLVPNTDANGKYVDIWPQIQADFDFARKNLLEGNRDFGRANKWAAEAYYAKTRLYMGNEGDGSGYTDALSVLNDIMTNGKTNQMVKYGLYKDYHTNFDADRENGSEWVWGVQHSANDGLPGVNPANA